MQSITTRFHIVSILKTTSNFKSYTTPSTRSLYQPRINFIQPRQFRRAMATNSGPILEWMVIAPDFDGALQKRLSVRPKHLEGLSSDPDTFWLWGGMSSPPPPPSYSLPLPQSSDTIVLPCCIRNRGAHVLTGILCRSHARGADQGRGYQSAEDERVCDADWSEKQGGGCGKAGEGCLCYGAGVGLGEGADHSFQERLEEGFVSGCRGMRRLRRRECPSIHCILKTFSPKDIIVYQSWIAQSHDSNILTSD